MLINVNPLISPEILQLIRSMGHGDKFVLSDANFPSYSHANKLYRMDGLSIQSQFIHRQVYPGMLVWPDDV